MIIRVWCKLPSMNVQYNISNVLYRIIYKDYIFIDYDHRLGIYTLQRFADR